MVIFWVPWGIFLVTILQPDGNADDQAFDDLIVEIQNAERLLKNVTIESEVLMGNELTGPNGVRRFTPGEEWQRTKVVLDGHAGGMKRYEAEARKQWRAGAAPYIDIHHLVAYNGEISTRYRPKSRTGVIHGDRHETLTHDCWYTSEFDALQFAYGDRRFSDVLREKRDQVEIDFQPTKVEGAIEIFIPGRGPHERTRRFWLDPEKGYAIVRQEIGEEKGFPPDAVCEDYELKQFGPGLWYPVSVVRRWTRQDRVEKLTVSKIKLNDPNFDYSKDRFVIDYPPGTNVEDKRTGGKRVVGGFMLAIKQGIDGLFGVGNRKAGAPTTSSRLVLILGGIVAAAALITLVIYFRRKNARQRRTV
jgi:hypothetical protein